MAVAWDARIREEASESAAAHAPSGRAWSCLRLGDTRFRRGDAGVSASDARSVYCPEPADKGDGDPGSERAQHSPEGQRAVLGKDSVLDEQHWSTRREYQAPTDRSNHGRAGAKPRRST
jgi:hypothetical protein